MSLLRDPEFRQGFGAAFIYGHRPNRPVARDAYVPRYRDISPDRIHLIPDGPVTQVGPRWHPWDFQEGLHQNYTDANGNHVDELHVHRLVVNHVVETNTPHELRFAQFNNDGLPEGSPGRDTRLVKRITSDRRGTLRIHYNSRNEIRNAAIDHSAEWAKDTWPHLLINQRFYEHPRLADWERLDFKVSFCVHSMEQFSDWPRTLPGRTAQPTMNLKFMILLRSIEDPMRQLLFAGMLLYTSHEPFYRPHLGVEQHGKVFFRDSIAEYQNLPQLGRKYTVEREIKALIADALSRGRKKQPGLSAELNDYYLSNFSIGLEGMGHWETELEISGLSLTGTPVTRVGLRPTR